ncbi:coiled-coil domain-containing protein [Streptomyces triticirhizae]|uniref:Uncharacterized protein n=1 Tax=Streptomyces triticirhizae TaxID=2483353 RepID=A0A3M2MAE4_9ACTN|nr:hypothetical protein [Streptomyces triticirhizae]RMI46754.1 hypothetical protein EBN88_00550 [Streptomyces triticirhizae]
MEFKFLRQEWLIDGVWDGLSHAAQLRHYRATTGSAGSLCAESAWVALGATTPLTGLPEPFRNQVKGIRLTLGTASGVWTASCDLSAGEVEFACLGGGEVQRRSVKPKDGSDSAGRFALGLMGVPSVETESGKVTIDSVMRLLYFPQALASSPTLFGHRTGGTDHDLTMRIVLGISDERACHLRSRQKVTASGARKAANRLEKARERRRAQGLFTEHEFDVEEQRLRERLREAKQEQERTAQSFKERTGCYDELTAQVASAREQVSAAAGVAQEAAHRIGPLLERLGGARERYKVLREELNGRTGCPACRQSLPSRAPGLCGVCGQHAAEIEAQLGQEEKAADEKASALVKSVADARQAEETAVRDRLTAEKKLSDALSDAEAYRVSQIAPAEEEKARAETMVKVTQARLEALAEHRRELTEISLLEREVEHTATRAEEAKRAWEVAQDEVDAQQQRVAKELSRLYSDYLLALTDRSEVRTASIDALTLRPRANGRPIRELATSAGLLALANLAMYLALFTAARTLPGARLPGLLWADSPFDGLGAGDVGERHTNAALRAIIAASADAGEAAQLILTTAHDLPTTHPGVRTTAFSPDKPFIPHGVRSTTS